MRPIDVTDLRTYPILGLVVALAGCSAPTAPEDDQPIQPTPTATSSSPAGEHASLRDLPAGPAPRIGYVDHGSWLRPDGSVVELPATHGISAITPYGGGFFIADTRHFEGSIGLVRTDPSGRVVETWTSSGSAALGPNGSVAWTSFVPLESGEAGRSLVHREDLRGRETTQVWPHRAPFTVAGFIDDRVVVDGAFQLPVELLDPSGARTALGLAGASDVAGTLVAGNLDPDGDRSGVVDARDGELLWQVRGAVMAFSPSGRRVVVSDRRGRDWWVARATDGRRLWTLDLPARPATSAPAWEDEEHLLAPVALRNRTAILRLGRDGLLERATRVVRHDPNRPPYVLATR